MKWEFHYSQRVTNYLVALRESGAEIRRAIRSLQDTNDGFPPDGITQLEPNIYRWQVAGHLVVCQRQQEESRLRIVVVESIESSGT